MTKTHNKISKIKLKKDSSSMVLKSEFQHPKFVKLLTGKLQEGVSTQDGADAVFSSTLVSPIINGLACIVYY